MEEKQSGLTIRADTVQLEADCATGCDQLREIHHQVKNNLQIVISLLRIQSRGFNDPSVRAVFRRGEERIQSMALVYDTLYRGDSLSLLPLKEYLTEMLHQLAPPTSSAGRRAPGISCEIDPIHCSSKVATHCGLLVNELVSHRLRQTSIDGTPLEIDFRLVELEDEVHVELRDNGPCLELSQGISQVEQQIFDALVRQLEGSACYVPGVSFELQVSLPKRVFAE